MLQVPINNLKDLPLLRQWQQEKKLIAFALCTEELAIVALNILLFPPVNFRQNAAKRDAISH